MTSNKSLTTSRRDDTAIGTSRETPDARSGRGVRGGEDRFWVSGGENQFTNDEPRLPKGYRYIRSAVEAVLECLGEHGSS